MNLNRITETLQNWIDPLPPAQTATSLEEVRTAVMTTPEHLDVSVEWIQHLDGKGGQYAIRPARDLCCSTTAPESSSRSEATKKAIQTELRAKLAQIKNPAVGMFSKVSAQLTSKAKETESERQSAIQKLETFIGRLEAAHLQDPNAPIDREFLANIFSEHDLKEVTEGKTAATNAVTENPSHEIQESEVQEIVTLLNFVKQEPEAGRMKGIGFKEMPQDCRKNALRDLLNPGNIIFSSEAKKIAAGLSPEAKSLIRAIRIQKDNWIDRSLADNKQLSLNTALEHVIAQFPD